MSNQGKISPLLSWLCYFYKPDILLILGVVGWHTGALSLLADALHSITDSANNVLGLVTIRLASPQPDRQHPYERDFGLSRGGFGVCQRLESAQS